MYSFCIITEISHVALPRFCSLLFRLVFVLLSLLFVGILLSFVFFGRILFLALFFGFLVGEFVVDEIVESDDGSDQRSGVNDEHLVVGVHVDGANELGVRQVRQEVENVLKFVGDFVVHRQFTVDNLKIFNL